MIEPRKEKKTKTLYFQRIWFFEVFSSSPIPSSTFVISYILLFWTYKYSKQTWDYSAIKYV